jgi:glycerate kinase
MTHWLAALGVADAPGTGAAGGAAAAVRALDGRVLRGAALCAELAGLERTLRLADVVITGCTSFHVGNRGGRVVRYVADLAVAAERPCLVVAVESTLSRREMRSFGVEAAYATGIGPLPEALTATSVRLARSWTALSEPRVDLSTEGIPKPDNGLDRVDQTGEGTGHDS